MKTLFKLLGVSVAVFAVAAGVLAYQTMRLKKDLHEKWEEAEPLEEAAD